MNYIRFLRYRGIHDPKDPAPYFTRGVVACWAKPGFHRFWQYWNPPVAYLIFRLFALLRRSGLHTVPATLIVFATCGFAHDVVGIAIIGSLQLKGALIFLFFGAFALLSSVAQPLLRQQRWPPVANVITNAVLVWLAFALGSLANTHVMASAQ